MLWAKMETLYQCGFMLAGLRRLQVRLPLTALVKWNQCPCGFDTNLGKHLLKVLLVLAATKDQLRRTLLQTRPSV